jgi:signal transduction histidine kinase
MNGGIILVSDISAQQLVERQKDEFISTASHEMRTPIAAIEGYISLALNEKAATVDVRARKYLESAHKSVGHLGQLFQDLLSVTKAEQNLVQEAVTAVNVEKVVAEAVGDMQFTAQAKGLSLGLQTSSGGGRTISPTYWVAANPERLREVTLNLIDNAVKYTPQGGIRVLVTGDETTVQVAVIDTGIGIATEDIPHLFQKFYRVDTAMTRGIGGTGLGLYLCRRIIELYNGHIWVESKPEQGSRISYALPRLSQFQADQLAKQSAATVTPTAAVAAAPRTLSY